MEIKPYLIFKQNGLLWGVEVACVREIFFLPELTPIAEAPQDIVGAIDLRGSILPVMDLNLRFGYVWQEYSLTDSAIVIEWQEFRVGIIVNQVTEVKHIPEEAITPQLSYGRDKPEAPDRFLAGFARCGTDIIMLVDLDRLIRYSPDKTEVEIPFTASGAGLSATAGKLETQNLQLEIDPNLLAEDAKVLVKPHVFCPNATAQEKAIFRERAHNLRLQGDRENSAAINLSLAVVVLNGEYFGINLAVVREFTDIRQVTPVPCTPDRIIGNMNLRGEILTLVDIRNVLNMSADIKSLSKAIVVEIEDLVAGIVVDEILNIIYLNVAELATIPAALNSSNREYLLGTAVYEEKIIAVLNLQKLLTKGGVVVEEEV
ncbi:chemotaxis protein CheW [Microcoleus sp. A003_D6]|uniref:chemotaxis protein CheW n=1 Tax=Microcoleus sp. A003_D6 TaxID=3055266 RepID=UPI002FD506B9